jgi:hypothetical protein
MRMTACSKYEIQNILYFLFGISYSSSQLSAKPTGTLPHVMALGSALEPGTGSADVSHTTLWQH